jgi:hypothetical protein
VLDDGMRLKTVRSIEQSATFAEQVKTLPAADEPAREAERLRTQLLAQTPRAVLAQQQMDAHPHGYHNREKRLYELIDFNDTFVSYVLATRHRDLPGLSDRLKQDMIHYCRRLNTPMFSDEQYDAIVRGLGREIAVYRSATFKGFKVRMTSRTEDAFGIDMVITQPISGRILNIDCKTPPAFRHRLEDLAQHGRIDDEDIVRADEQGYWTLEHRRGQERVPVTLLCILPDRLGEIRDFTFEQPERLEAMLNTIFASLD